MENPQLSLEFMMPTFQGAFQRRLTALRDALILRVDEPCLELHEPLIRAHSQLETCISELRQLTAHVQQERRQLADQKEQWSLKWIDTQQRIVKYQQLIGVDQEEVKGKKVSFNEEEAEEDDEVEEELETDNENQSAFANVQMKPAQNGNIKSQKEGGSKKQKAETVQKRRVSFHHSTTNSVPKTTTVTAAAAPAKATAPKCKKVSQVSAEEWETVPKYLMNRWTMEKFNQGIDLFNHLVRDKYILLQKQPNQLSKELRQKYWELKDAVTPETRGYYFITEKDIKQSGTGQLKMDPAGRSLLSILRHCGRIKEVRGQGHTRFVLLR